MPNQAVFLCAFVGIWPVMNSDYSEMVSGDDHSPTRQVLVASGNVSASTACAAEAETGHHRAGHPERLACYAQSSNDCHYSGGYVGGGTRFHGCDRFAPEGTWGRDYCGGLLSHRPWLNWSHGRRSQGGSGAYKTDGPKLFGH